MRLVLVHGWGFHSGIWLDMLARLDGIETDVVDLGFCKGTGPRALTSLPADAVYVGHSFGLLWLLRHGPRPMKGVVSIAGFDCFHAHVAPSAIDPIRAGIVKNLPAQMKHFWRQCGAPGFDAREFDRATLLAGLDWLTRWDARKELEEVNAPVLALASEDDAIVPAAASRAIWAERAELHVRTDGGHALPLTRPDWCAERIAEFVHGLGA